RDAHVLGDSLRTDWHCFRLLSAEDAMVVELREWSRMTEDLQQERNRLANRVREQLWRYYPQALVISDDLAADWFLELWAAAPTPAKAARIRESTVDGIEAPHPADCRGGGAAAVATETADSRPRHCRSGQCPHSHCRTAPHTGEPPD